MGRQSNKHSELPHFYCETVPPSKQWKPPIHKFSTAGAQSARPKSEPTRSLPAIRLSDQDSVYQAMISLN